MCSHGTTIFAIKHNGQYAMASDSLTSMGWTILKQTSSKVKYLNKGNVIVGSSGLVADCITLTEKLEKKIEDNDGDIAQASVLLSKDLRDEKTKLEASIVVMSKDYLLYIDSVGAVHEPDDDMWACGSGGDYALSAGRALKKHASHLSAKDIATEALKMASSICLYTNDVIKVKEL